MNKNLIMIVCALGAVLLIVFWVQYSIVKSLQGASTVDGTTVTPAPAPGKVAGAPGAAPGAATPTAAVGKKTTITAPVHKHK